MYVQRRCQRLESELPKPRAELLLFLMRDVLCTEEYYTALGDYEG